jgi:CRISPR-associated protein Cas5d
MEGKSGELYLATPESIQQRAAMVLKDVRYIIDAHFEMTDKASPGDNEGKFQEMTRRRIEKGQFYHQPCFGTREFSAFFQLCTQRPACPEELKGEKDLGWMQLDMDYSNPADIRPRFFRAVMHDGFIDVPPAAEGVMG